MRGLLSPIGLVWQYRQYFEYFLKQTLHHMIMERVAEQRRQDIEVKDRPALNPDPDTSQADLCLCRHFRIEHFASWCHGKLESEDFPYCECRSFRLDPVMSENDARLRRYTSRIWESTWRPRSHPAYRY